MQKQAVKQPKGLVHGEAMKRYGHIFSSAMLDHWSRVRCIYLGRKLLRWRERVPHEGPGRVEVWVYSRKDLKTIAEKKLQRSDSAYTHPETGKVYIGSEQFAARIGLPKGGGGSRTWLRRYLVMPHPALGRTLDSCKVAHPVTKYASVRKYAEEDAETVRRWKLAQVSPDDRAIAALKVILAKGPVESHDVLERMRTAGVPANRFQCHPLRHAKKTLNVRSVRVGFQGAVYRCLPKHSREQVEGAARRKVEAVPSAESRKGPRTAAEPQPVQQAGDEHAHRTRTAFFEEEALEQQRQLHREQAEMLANILKAPSAQEPKEERTPEPGPTPTKPRKKPAAAKHARWKELRDAGKSYGDIVQIHLDETGKEVSREAVINALRRLEEDESEEGGRRC